VFVLWVCLRWFQSTLPRGERRRQMDVLPGRVGFNPRSRGGSDDVAAFVKIDGTFQSTLPRGERQHLLHSG